MASSVFTKIHDGRCKSSLGTSINMELSKHMAIHVCSLTFNSIEFVSLNICSFILLCHLFIYKHIYFLKITIKFQGHWSYISQMTQANYNTGLISDYTRVHNLGRKGVFLICLVYSLKTCVKYLPERTLFLCSPSKE
jgi:hypothetical protein